ARVAEALAGQLGSEGIDVRTEHVKPRGLFSGPLQVPTGDESEHDRTAETATTGEDPEAEQSDGSSVGTTVDIAVVPQESGPDAATVLASRFGCGAGSDTPATVRASAAAYCADGQLQSLIGEALAGESNTSDVLAQLEPELWNRCVTVPLFQRAEVLAVRDGLAGVDVGGDIVRTFESAPEWRRVR